MKSWEQPYVPNVGEHEWPAKDIEMVINNSGQRVAMDAFRDIYPAEEIASDKQTVARQAREHELNRLSGLDHRAEQIGQALEAAIEEAINLHGWFSGGQVEAHYIRTTLYDDFTNGVDGVLEFSVRTKTGQVHRLALAIDASLNKKTEALEKKISLSTKRVLGRPDAAITGPTTVKYFESKAEPYRGPLEHVVPVVVGIDAKDCFDLIERLARTIRLKEAAPHSETLSEKLQKETGALRAHPAQIIFLKEIELQLRRYRQLLDTPMAIAPTVKKKDLEILLGIIKYIAEAKHYEGVALGEFEQDGVFAEIKRQTVRLATPERATAESAAA